MPSSTQEDEPLFSGEPQFGSRDNRKEYSGKGLKGKGKGKPTGARRHCSANFDKKPTMPSDSASDGAKGSVYSDGSASGCANKGERNKAVSKGEKEKASRKQSSDRSTTRGGGSTNRGESSASGDGEEEVSVDDDFYFPNNKLGKLCWYLGKAHSAALCSICHRVCCALSKDLINVLIDYDEVEPSQKVYQLFMN